MPKIINIGVIGCGYWGPNLIRNFQAVKNASVTSVADLKKERLDFIKKNLPFVKTTRDAKEIIKNPEIDAVVIATPISSHYPLAKNSLLAKKHVLVEKPMTTSVSGAEKLIKLAKKAKKTLMVSHTFEYTGAINKIKEFIKRGEIGQIYYFESTRINLGLFQKDTNVIWDLAPHDISIAIYVLNTMPISVSAFGQDHINKGLENTAYIILKFPKKIIGHIHISWLSPIKFRRTVIAGNKKMIVYDDIEPTEKVKVYNFRVEVSNKPKGVLERQLIYRTGDVYIPQLDSTEPLYNECSHFVECILNNKTPRSDGLSGLRVVRVLEAIDKSIKGGGKEVKL